LKERVSLSGAHSWYIPVGEREGERGNVERVSADTLREGDSLSGVLIKI